MFRGSPLPENPFPISFCLRFLLPIRSLNHLSCMTRVMILVSAHSQILEFHMQQERTLKALASSFSATISTISICCQTHRMCQKNHGTTEITIRSHHKIDHLRLANAELTRIAIKNVIQRPVSKVIRIRVRLVVSQNEIHHFLDPVLFVHITNLDDNLSSFPELLQRTVSVTLFNKRISIMNAG